MDRLVFTANGTINAQAMVRNVLVNEVANVSTVGFKRSFDAALRTVKAEGAGFDTRYQLQPITRDIIQMTPGAVMTTGRNLDIAIAGRAVLAVQAKDGVQAYTRRGDLQVNLQGQLETGGGHLVLGQGGPITVPPGFELRINSDGSIYARDPAQAGNQAPVLLGQLRLKDSTGTDLGRREDGLFKVAGQPDGADFPNGPELPSVISGALEGSNVNAMEAMTRLIDHSRSFEMQIRMIKETKDLDESGASMMRST
ncbi:MAG: Flagellar basal-body rod protein FlgF [Pseudomonadota bacterium]|jgi:flagellar basal-body rod protein FlgF